MGNCWAVINLSRLSLFAFLFSFFVPSTVGRFPSFPSTGDPVSFWFDGRLLILLDCHSLHFSFSFFPINCWAVFHIFALETVAFPSTPINSFFAQKNRPQLMAGIEQL